MNKNIEHRNMIKDHNRESNNSSHLQDSDQEY